MDMAFLNAIAFNEPSKLGREHSRLDAKLRQDESGVVQLPPAVRDMLTQAQAAKARM